MKLSQDELAIIQSVIKTRRPNTRTTVTIRKGWNIGLDVS